MKNGAILPKDVENNSQLFLNGDEDRIFEVYPAGTTTFDLYDDDGMSQDYKEGLGTMTHITSEAPEAGEKGDAVITVGKMSGTFEGMKSERGTQFIVNVSEKPETVTATIGGEEVTLKEVSHFCSHFWYISGIQLRIIWIDGLLLCVDKAFYRQLHFIGRNVCLRELDHDLRRRDDLLIRKR